MPAAITFLTGGGSLSKEFTASAPTDKGQLVPGASVVVLTPKQPSAHYAQLVLVVDPTTWTVTRSIVTEPSGASNTFDFTAVNLKAKQNASVFVFSPQRHPTYRIVTVAAPAAPPSAPAPALTPKTPAPAPAPKK